MQNKIVSTVLIAVSIVVIAAAFIGIMFVFDFYNAEQVRDALIKLVSAVGIGAVAVIILSLLLGDKRN